MIVNYVSSLRRRQTLALLAVTLGATLWAAIGTLADVSGSSTGSVAQAAQCHNAVDVVASMDRSRNGISLTCTSETLSAEIAR